MTKPCVATAFITFCNVAHQPPWHFTPAPTLTLVRLLLVVLQNLNNASAYDAQQQWKLNIDMAARLGLTSATGMSFKGVVTPQITGLFNVSGLMPQPGVGGFGSSHDG